MTSGISTAQPTAITIAATVVAVSRPVHSDSTPTAVTGTPRPA